MRQRNHMSFQEMREKYYAKEYFACLLLGLKNVAVIIKFHMKGWFSYLKKIIKNLPSGNASYIQKQIHWLQKELENGMQTENYKTDITYVMSRCMDRLQSGENDSYTLFLHAITRSFTESPIGKVLLFNRWKCKMPRYRTFLNKAIQAFWYRWEHATIVSDYDAETKTIYLTQSSRESDQRNGVFTETLQEYFHIHKAKSLDVIVVDTPSSRREKIVAFVCEQKKARGYDVTGLIRDALIGRRTDETSHYYCSNLIIGGLVHAGISIDKNIFQPGQLVEILQPVYACSLPLQRIVT